MAVAIPNLDLTAMANTAIPIFASIIFGLFVIGVIAVVYYLWKTKRILQPWPVNVVIFERRADKIIPAKKPFDKARHITDNKTNESYYVLKKRNVKFQDIGYKDIMQGDWLFLYTPQRDEFHPMTIKELVHEMKSGESPDINSVEVEPILMREVSLDPVLDPSMKLAYATQVEKNYARFVQQSAWEKYLPLVTLAVVGIMLVMMLYVTVQQMGPIAAGLNSAANSMSSVANSMQQIATNLADNAATGITNRPPA